MQTIAEKLSTDERQVFAACEKIISAGLKTFSEVGNALLHIRKNRLYREGFTSFEKYCREKWAMSDRRAHQLCDAAEVVNNIQGLNPGSVIPECERHVRPLVGLKPEEQAEAFQKARVIAATDGRQVQAKDVEAAVEEIKPKTMDDKLKDAFGGTIPPIPQEREKHQLWPAETVKKELGILTEEILKNNDDPEELEKIKHEYEEGAKRIRLKIKELHHKSTLKAA